MGREIYASWPLLLISIIPDRAGPEQSGVSGKKGQYSYEEASSNALSTTITMSASPTTSATTPPKVGYSGNTPRNNCQSADTYAPVRFLSPKPLFGDQISSGKADESIFCIMPKVVFVEEVDDDDIDFELASCNYIHRTSKLFAGDNQTQESVMAYNVARLPGGQGLLGTESLRKKQLDK